jgi:hypothetical protein
VDKSVDERAHYSTPTGSQSLRPFFRQKFYILLRNGIILKKRNFITQICCNKRQANKIKEISRNNTLINKNIIQDT